MSNKDTFFKYITDGNITKGDYIAVGAAMLTEKQSQELM